MSLFAGFYETFLQKVLLGFLRLMGRWTAQIGALELVREKNRLGRGVNLGRRGEIFASGAPNDFSRSSRTSNALAHYTEKPLFGCGRWAKPKAAPGKSMSKSSFYNLYWTGLTRIYPVRCRLRLSHRVNTDKHGFLCGLDIRDYGAIASKPGRFSPQGFLWIDWIHEFFEPQGA